MSVSSKRQMELQRARVEKGLCYKCPNPHEEGTRWCTDCRLYHRNYMERWRQQRPKKVPVVCRICLVQQPFAPWHICKPCHQQLVRKAI